MNFLGRAFADRKAPLSPPRSRLKPFPSPPPCRPFPQGRQAVRFFLNLSSFFPSILSPWIINSCPKQAGCFPSRLSGESLLGQRARFPFLGFFPSFRPPFFFFFPSKPFQTTMIKNPLPFLLRPSAEAFLYFKDHVFFGTLVADLTLWIEESLVAE